MSAGSKRNENVAWRQLAWRLQLLSAWRRRIVSPEASAKWPELKRRSEMKEIGSWRGWRKRSGGAAGGLPSERNRIEIAVISMKTVKHQMKMAALISEENESESCGEN
jgi:hypothetical protein